jgi:hypothetical protein
MGNLFAKFKRKRRTGFWTARAPPLLNGQYSVIVGGDETTFLFEPSKNYMYYDDPGRIRGTSA